MSPTLGLITRLSPDEPDPRAAAVATNVRFEKGVVKNAFGLMSLTLNPGLDSPANLIFQTKFFIPANDVGIIGTSRKIYFFRVPILGSPARLYQLFDFGSALANTRNRSLADSFFNKVILAQPNNQLLFWDGVAAMMKPVPGLDPTLRWKGVKTFRSYVLIWSDTTLKWCATNDVFDWIPVAASATSGVFNTTMDFTMVAVDQTTDWIYVDSSVASLLVIGQFVRFDLGSTRTFLTVSAIIPGSGQIGVASGFSQTVPATSQKDIFLNVFVPYVKGGKFSFAGSSVVLTVQKDAVAPPGDIAQLSLPFTTPAVGSTVVATTEQTPPFPLGQYVSIGFNLNPGNDIFQVQAVNLSLNQMTLLRIGVSGSRALGHSNGEFIVAQPFVTVKNDSTSPAVSAFSTQIKEFYGFQGTVNDLTGVTLAGTVVPTGTQIFTEDSNGAGEDINAGSIVNGPILALDTLGDYAYILKNRSIQSIQYVGLDQGTFFIRPEVSDEGLIGRYSFVKVGLDVMYIFGNREFYRYSGGSQLVPIGRQHSVQVLAELDKTRVDEIIGYHNETDFEIWFIYPVIGLAPTDSPYRVFIYNYAEDSCTIDDYDPSAHPSLVLHGITGLGRLDLSANPSWDSATGTWVAPGLWPATATCQDLESDGSNTVPVASFKNNELLGGPVLSQLNQGYTRDGVAMLCRYESVDFSAGDPLAFKYGDTVQMSLQVLGLAQQPNPFVVQVQLGSKANLDDDIVWSNPVAIQVQGNGNYVTKANMKRTGRYLRVRVTSNQVGCGWRVSRLTVLGRMGGTY